jgi:phosphoserine phosphatase
MPEPIPAVWPPVRLVVFDCDSTLSAVEGIDELAQLTRGEGGTSLEIARLTKQAMDGEIPLESVYGHRLGTLNPTQSHVQELARIYRQKVIPDAPLLIEALQAAGSQVFIVSGGLIEPVREFGVWLGVPREHIFAVDMEYDQLSGKWWQYWLQSGGQNPRGNYLAVGPSPLTRTGGKNRVIHHLRAAHPGRIMMVGDGLSDLETMPDVDLFIGFGGVVHRQRIAEESRIYIHSASLAPVLPLALGQLGNIPKYTSLWADGLKRIYNQEATFQDPDFRQAFLDSLQTGRNI